MADSDLSEKDVDEAVRSMIAMGIMGRWWCESCEGWVPYRTEIAREAIDGGGKRGVAYGEAASRLAHNTQHQAKS